MIDIDCTREELRAHKETHDKTNSWWLNDARGIPLSRVCDTCYDAVIESYPPEVVGKYGRYEDVVEDCIDDE